MSTATASPARARKARILAPPVTGQEIVLIGVIALLWTLLAFNTPAFLTASSIQPLLGNVAPIALIGIHAHDGRVLGPMDLEWREAADVGKSQKDYDAAAVRPELGVLR